MKEIYTEDFVEKELKSLLEELKTNKEYVYLWELFEDKKYSRQRYSEWVKQYKDNKNVKLYSDTIKEILETRAIVWAMKNKLNATSVIFHMKNNYNWKDKQEIDNTHKIQDYQFTSNLEDEEEMT